ncbi:MAG: HDOD domain-containing protein [Desulfovibrio sp.]
MKQNIAFVDDEINILSALKRMLHSKSKEWNMHFFSNAQDALDKLDELNINVLITDMRMPGMDGAELLEIVTEKYPDIVRIVLSGHSDSNVIMKSILPAHQYIAKPCKASKLVGTINKALSLQSMLDSNSVKNFTTEMAQIPTLPEVYQKLTRELQEEEPSIQAVGKIVSQDVGMSAKLLKIVNSSFFGLCQHISSPQQAVSLLGISTIKSLILGIHIFSSFNAKNTPKLKLADLWSHCIRTGHFSKIIATHEGVAKDSADYYFIAGLLHDIGQLIIAEKASAQYNKILTEAEGSKLPLHLIEAKHLGTSHAEVGAYLIGLWGLPTQIVRGIAFHHTPLFFGKNINEMVVIHAANYFDHKLFYNAKHHDSTLDKDFQAFAEHNNKLEQWENLITEYALEAGYDLKNK